MKFQIITKYFIYFSLLAFVTGGCVAGGPHLQLESRGGEPAGEPGEVPTPVETVTLPQGGSGAVRMGSENFRSYTTSSSTFGGRASGNIYRMVSPELSLGTQATKE